MSSVTSGVGFDNCSFGLQLWLKNIIAAALAGVCLIDDFRDIRQERHRENGVYCFRRVLNVAGKESDFASPTPRKHLENFVGCHNLGG